MEKIRAAEGFKASGGGGSIDLSSVSFPEKNIISMLTPMLGPPKIRAIRVDVESFDRMALAVLGVPDGRITERGRLFIAGVEITYSEEEAGLSDSGHWEEARR
jgi:hypothetical protein